MKKRNLTGKGCIVLHKKENKETFPLREKNERDRLDVSAYVKVLTESI